MVLSFCANLSFMYNESDDLLERYQLAASDGFKAVECAFPYSFPICDVVQAKMRAGVEQVLINSFPGDSNAGELGLSALPLRQDEFRNSLATAVEYCKALDCKKLHIMAGKCLPQSDSKEMDETFKENLLYAANLLEKEGITGLIEPISPAAVKDYYMNSFPKAVEIICGVNSSSLKLQLDIYHLQLLEGNLTSRIKSLLPYTGHIQISQAPERNQPDAEGELDYRYMLQLLEKYGYGDYIGLEYKPQGSTSKSLGWISQWGYTL